jgi:hypothetical protein
MAAKVWKGGNVLFPKNLYLVFSKNTPITGFFVCQRKGKFGLDLIQ